MNGEGVNSGNTTNGNALNVTSNAGMSQANGVQSQAGVVNGINAQVQSQAVGVNNINAQVQPQAGGVNNVNAQVQPQAGGVNNVNAQVQPQAGGVNSINAQVQSKIGGDNLDNKAISREEKFKKAQENYKPPGKFKTFILLVFFALLIAFIIFLPEIQAFVAEYKSGNQTVEEITTGKLVCTIDSNTVNLDKSVERIFSFTDKKLESAKFTTTIRGDITKDADALDELANQCNLIKQGVAGIDGITVGCEYEEGKIVEREHFDYKTFDIEKVRSAYTEAGGDVVEFEYGYDIDKVMTSMRQGGFTCNKEK